MNQGFDWRRVLGESAGVSVATISGGVLLFLANLYLARFFGPAEFGQFRVLVALFSFLATVLELGQGPLLVRHIALFRDDRVPELLRRVLLLRGVGYAILIAVTLTFRDQLAVRFLKDPGGGSLIVAGCVLAACFYFEITKSIVLGHQRIRLYAISVWATSAANGVLAVAFALVGGVGGAVVGWGLGYLIGNAVNLYDLAMSGDLRATGARVGIGRILWSYGLPMHLVQGLASLELAVVPLFGLLYDRQAIGALAFASVFYRSATRVTTSFSLVLFPHFSRLADDPATARASLGQASRLFAPLLAIGVLITLTLADPIVSLIDPSYLYAVPVFRALVVYSVLAGYGSILTSYYAGIGRPGPAIAVSAAQQVGLVLASYLGLEAMAG